MLCSLVRYQQATVRAEWAYNLCSGAEQMLDEPQVKLFWGVLNGHLSEDIYRSHLLQWRTLRDNLYTLTKHNQVHIKHIRNNFKYLMLGLSYKEIRFIYYFSHLTRHIDFAYRQSTESTSPNVSNNCICIFTDCYRRWIREGIKIDVPTEKRSRHQELDGLGEKATEIEDDQPRNQFG